MNIMHYIGFDIHKKVISFCEKKKDGTVVDQGTIRAYPCKFEQVG